MVRWVAIAFGLAIVAIGVVAMVDPALLLGAATFTQTSVGLYIAAGLRVVFGLVLIGSATSARLPRTVRILGAFIVLAGIVTPFVGIERVGAIVEWWSAQGVAFLRAWGMLAAIFGLFIIYAVTPRRRRAESNTS
jgi:hypothetical protein